MVDNGDGWTESTVEVEGHDVFYRESADVPGALPIVHVHGFGDLRRLPHADRPHAGVARRQRGP